MRRVSAVILVLGILACSADAFAQFRGRRDDRSGGEGVREGGRDGGSFRGPGGESGGFRGSNGGPGAEGGDRRSRMEGFLRSMDSNGDGIIEEAEVPEERQRMFRFMAERAGVDPSQGVSIAKVVEGMANRGGGSPQGGARPGQPPTGAAPDQSTAPAAEAPAATTAQKLLLLVPGFGVDRRPEPVPGFGTRVQSQSRVVFGSVAAAKEGENIRSGQPRVESRSEAAQDGASNEDGFARDNSTAHRRSSYRFLLPHERLPEGLPDWFIDRDSNLDGQVTMAEFAGDWTDAKVEEFLKYDVNNDGVITVEEVLNPVEHAAEPTGEGGHTPAVERTETSSGNGGGTPAQPVQSPQPAPSPTGDAPKPWWLES